MTYRQALQQAKRRACEMGEFRYIVREPEEGYQVAGEVDLDTFFLGATPLTCIGPDGLEYARRPSSPSRMMRAPT